MAHIITLKSRLEDARRTMQARLEGRTPEIGLVLGSGLNGFAEHI